MHRPAWCCERVGATLVYRVGGAAGPLFGAMFREAGASLGTAERASPEDVLAALRAGLDGVQGLGAAVEGDKTIVDAYAARAAGARTRLAANRDLAEAAANAAEAAREGVRATVPLQARKGRASYLGPAQRRAQDPGATSTALLFVALARVVSGPT